MTRIEAPFTDDQCAALNRWQNTGLAHPFTCGKRDDHNGNDILLALPDGWICPFPGCDYKQNWAHDYMLCDIKAAMDAAWEQFGPGGHAIE